MSNSLGLVKLEVVQQVVMYIGQDFLIYLKDMKSLLKLSVM